MSKNEKLDIVVSDDEMEEDSTIESEIKFIREVIRDELKREREELKHEEVKKKD